MGDSYLNLTNDGTNSKVTTPDHASFDFSAGIEVIARVKATDYTPGSSYFVANQDDGSNQRSWGFAFTGTGGPFLVSSSAGNAYVYNNSISAAPPFVDGTWYWCKWTFNPNVAGQAQVTFSYAADAETEPASWTVTGTLTSQAAHTLFNATSNIRIGSRGNNTLPFVGNIKRVIIRNAASGGTTVLDVDFTNQANGTTSFTETQGRTMTLGSGASIVDPTPSVAMPFVAGGLGLGLGI